MVDERSARQPSARRMGLTQGWPVALVALAVAIYGGLAGLQWALLERAHDAGRAAAATLGGDEVTALAAVARDESRSLSERNHAIWALAQLADAQALPQLESLETGRPCDHDHAVCQYELRKAIERCSGRRQPPRWLPLFPHPGQATRRQ